MHADTTPAPDSSPWWSVQRGGGPVVATAIHDGAGLRSEVQARMALDCHVVRAGAAEQLVQRYRTLAGTNFTEKIIDSIERKLEIAREFPGHFSNQALAVM